MSDYNLSLIPPSSPAAPTLCQLATGLAGGRFTASELIADAQRLAVDPKISGHNTFPYGPDQESSQRASDWDRARSAGAVPHFAGVPISIKDNIAQAGQPLRAGSTFLAADGPAATDATILTRLVSAGFISIGRTNMTELAFSGLGLNPHFDTPLNPVAPDRVPGGSSAGAAVSVASRIVPAAIGTDTSGSCRIPAAFCGLVGFKSTARRTPLDGVYPLSPSLDSVGVIASSVACCAAIDAVMADEVGSDPSDVGLASLNFADLSPALVLDTAPEVSKAYADAVARLKAAGVTIESLECDLLSRTGAINLDGGFGALELYAYLRGRLPAAAEQIDPRILRRILMGASISDRRAEEMRTQRHNLILWANALLQRYTAVLMPTAAICAPSLASVHRDEDYERINRLALRNAGVANLLDRCAVTIPCQAPGELPVGFTIMGVHGGDRTLLSIATQLEAIVRG